MSNQTDHTIVRLRVPPELKKQIEDAAEKNNRSQSAEMVARLERSFDQKPDEQALMWKEEAEALTSEIRNLLTHYRER